ncbi:DUF4197 domain-containing protein [Rufibacter sp. LB8]|uniref:DUF4197 domain-containing protein n=1 Tax=Rufibacter sp. LB8 TaxID=2777781 RepID=UPI00178C19B6|nr:DUF4197 domain-containing protein [Rufibacter sp. LB8]
MLPSSASRFFLLLGVFFLAQTAFAQVNLKDLGKLKQIVNNPSATNPTDIGAALKEALSIGVSKGSDALSLADGFYKNPNVKIPFPPDVKRVEDRLRQLGMGSEVDKFVMALNRAAEDAATQAKPIFLNAIKQMTIQDAAAILKGQPDAATQYLRRTTSAQLQEAFQPIIQNSLNKVNATQYYNTLITAYNKIPLVQKVNPNLEDYATQKAMDGLFTVVAQEEQNIRQNPAARTTELLKKVFGK